MRTREMNWRLAAPEMLHIVEDAQAPRDAHYCHRRTRPLADFDSWVTGHPAEDPGGKLLKRQLREPYWESVGRRIH
jgi:hypothetical protein